VQPAPASDHPLTFEERGDIFMARKSYEDAVDYYYRALKQTRFANAIVWNKLGIAYQQLQNYSASRKAYNQAIRRQKDYTEPMNNIGTTYFMEKKYGKSVKYYLKAIKLNPDGASYHLNLGTSYMHMKKYKESVDEYRTALSLDPNIFSQRSAFGTTIEARGADPEYYFYLGKVFASLGRAEDAVRSLRRALEDGFKDRKRILDDPDFMKISQNPAYVELMNNPPVGIKE
jgi:tetratricopeptide (TPR) repeat protein